MTPGVLDDRYLRWLYSQVSNVRTRVGPRTYWQLFDKLFSTEFVWFVPNDDNRAEDGIDIRREWVGRFGVEVDSEWMGRSCSFLELLIGLSRRLSFEGGNDGRSWFWMLINNLGLQDCHDAGFVAEHVEEVTHAVIWRTYDQNGNGGLFPLQNAEQDQRQVEIWYQLSAYLLENS